MADPQTWVLDTGAWHLRVLAFPSDAADDTDEDEASSEDHVDVGQNQIGQLQHSEQTVFGTELELCLEQTSETATSEEEAVLLHFPKRLDEIEDLDAQVRLWAAAISEYDRSPANPTTAPSEALVDHGVEQNNTVGALPNPPAETPSESTFSSSAGVLTGEENGQRMRTVGDDAAVVLLGLHDAFDHDLLRVKKLLSGISNGTPSSAAESSGGIDSGIRNNQANKLFFDHTDYVRLEQYALTWFSAFPATARLAVLPDALMAAYALLPPGQDNKEAASTRATKNGADLHDRGPQPSDPEACLVIDLGFSAARVHLLGRRTTTKQTAETTTATSKVDTTSSHWQILAARTRNFHLGGYFLTRKLQQHLCTRHNAVCTGEDENPGDSGFTFYKCDEMKQRIARCSFETDGNSSGVCRFRWDESEHDFTRDPETLRDIRKVHPASDLRLLKEWAGYQLGEMLFQPCWSSDGQQPAEEDIDPPRATDGPEDYNPTLPEVVADLLRSCRDEVARMAEAESTHHAVFPRQALANVLLIGGGARMFGVANRLQLELQPLADESVRVQIHLGDELTALRGARRFVQQWDDRIPWITAEDAARVLQFDRKRFLIEDGQV
ncbi:unnamed protein product [Amoebophrya sp. A120]|nr:unnamed protein product [Amoebophrya sp. A120]|eukprot:GSA120T00023075001.1